MTVHLLLETGKMLKASAKEIQCTLYVATVNVPMVDVIAGVGYAKKLIQQLILKVKTLLLSLLVQLLSFLWVLTFSVSSQLTTGVCSLKTLTRMILFSKTQLFLKVLLCRTEQSL